MKNYYSFFFFSMTNSHLFMNPGPFSKLIVRDVRCNEWDLLLQWYSGVSGQRDEWANIWPKHTADFYDKYFVWEEKEMRVIVIDNDRICAVLSCRHNMVPRHQEIVYFFQGTWNRNRNLLQGAEWHLAIMYYNGLQCDTQFIRLSRMTFCCSYFSLFSPLQCLIGGIIWVIESLQIHFLFFPLSDCDPIVYTITIPPYPPEVSAPSVCFRNSSHLLQALINKLRWSPSGGVELLHMVPGTFRQ